MDESKENEVLDKLINKIEDLHAKEALKQIKNKFIYLETYTTGLHNRLCELNKEHGVTSVLLALLSILTFFGIGAALWTK